MDAEDVAALPAAAFRRGVKKVRRSPRTAGAVILGFDCEYDPDNAIMCYQLSDGNRAELLEAEVDLTWKELAHWTRVCLQKWGYKLTKCRNIFLVSHFSTAELSHVQHFWQDATVRRVSPQQVYNASYRVNEAMQLHVYDLYHFFNASLHAVAATFGEKKMEWDFEKRPTTRALIKDPDFIAYALNDAIITARIFQKFRDRVWNDHQVDVIRYPTPASVAMAVYRKDWLSDDVESPGYDVRRMSWKCLWGGRAEAYYQGDMLGDWTLRDVKSLYPRSAELLHELPLKDDWVRLSEPVKWRGLCTVKFSFPPDTTHPCLPVWAGDRLIFPLSGVSNCTLDEAKVAKRLGAELTWRIVWEYHTGDTSLSRYMTHWTAAKDAAQATGDQVGRELAKLFMNALIGKFSQHKGEMDIEDAKQAAIDIGVPLETILDPSFQHPLKPEGGARIGGNIMPEWSALILGKARAVMADILASTNSLICSTDSVLVPASQDHIVDSQMAAIGVVLTSKNENKKFDEKGRKVLLCADCPAPLMPVHRVRVIRSRCYVGLCPHDRVVWAATHAIHLPRRGDVAANFLLSDSTKYTKKQHIGLKTAARTGQPFFKSTDVPMTFRRAWDNKRLLQPGGASKPWNSARHYLQKTS